MKFRRSQHAKDLNQPEIVEALEKVGASVAVTSGLGGGFPDLVVGFQGKNYLLEVKRLSSSKTNSFKLTPKEVTFAQGWRGQYSVVTNIDEALALIGVTRGAGVPSNLATPRPKLEPPKGPAKP